MLDHDVFYNRERTGYEELMSYYPNFWKEILEMKANNRFAGYTLDLAAACMERMVADQFFESCSEEMVVRYENFLDVDNAGKDWGERRRFLKVAWSGGEKISGTKMKHAVRELYGGMTEVDVELRDCFYCYIRKLNPDAVMDKNVDRYLQKTLPAHIAFAVLYEMSFQAKMYVAGAVSVGEILEIRQVL